MSDPKPNGLILRKFRKTNKVEPACNFHFSVTQLTLGHIMGEIWCPSNTGEIVVASPHEERKEENSSKNRSIARYLSCNFSEPDLLSQFNVDYLAESKLGNVNDYIRRWYENFSFELFLLFFSFYKQIRLMMRQLDVKYMIGRDWFLLGMWSQTPSTEAFFFVLLSAWVSLLDAAGAFCPTLMLWGHWTWWWKVWILIEAFV